VREQDDVPAKRSKWLLRFLVPPIAALQFLTIFPAIVRRHFAPEEMGQAVGYFPLIGALLGGALAILNWGMTQIVSDQVSVALVLVAWVYATGALHLDGFLDTCDGLFGGHTPADRLRIMRDERIGAFAMAGGGLLFLVKYAALSTSPSRLASLLLAPLLGRWAMSGAIVLFAYARPKGVGRAIKDHAGWQQLVVSTAVTLIIAWLFERWLGLAAIVLVALTTWAAAHFSLKRLPGLTGDIYGAICEWTEAIVLVLITALPA
jgi:adenosylcobinamide-GDP ribazoletransferase